MFFLKVFLDFLRNHTILGAGFFALYSVHQDASFDLSNKAFGQFFIFFITRRDPFDLGWVKKLPGMEKRSKKNI